MKLQARRGSHLPVLIKLFYSTKGPVLELGCGLFSTVFLFWACVASQRRLVTYENNPEFFKWLIDFKNQIDDPVDMHNAYMCKMKMKIIPCRTCLDKAKEPAIMINNALKKITAAAEL